MDKQDGGTGRAGLEWTEADTEFVRATLRKNQKNIPTSYEETRAIHESLKY
ncbi:MAG: hypothetical protein MPJ05_06465 [Nitrosopumilus sp.]|nr:hypothetical protein [Nitrosopumilus sp.]MDA7997620.1 hypothetical protein [Nitrosopumilus sp.]CAI9832455.1 hypothetical protein IBTHAUMO2_780026 [Nitrosopumilaceae archaeon]